MASAKPSTVVGVFKEQDQAERAVGELRRAGFRDDQIGLVARDKKGKKVVKGKAKQETYAEEGALTGAAVGAGVGGLVGLGVLAGVIPVIGPAIAAGTLATILMNAAGGAAIAGLAGALIGLGIPEEEAEYYESELKAGRYLVTVKANRRTDEARTILRRNGGYDRHTAEGGRRTDATATARAGRAADADERSLELREEELTPRKTSVKKGEVKVRKDVVTESRTLQVPVTREEVVIERRPTAGRRAASSIREGEEIRIPVKEEQVSVEKRPVVREEVRVGKRRVQKTEPVSGTVRKERLRVEPEGDVDVRGETARQTRVTPRSGRR